VWLKDEESESWHNSVGGGIWLAPVDALIFSLATYFPKESMEESPRFIFKVGFGFYLFKDAKPFCKDNIEGMAFAMINANKNEYVLLDQCGNILPGNSQP
jgi:hypothetical protein